VVEIDADVTELVPLADPEAARTFTERRAFERSTGLTDIGAAHPESYRTLRTLIEAYQQKHEIADFRIAAQRWYGDVYRPLWQQVRKRRLTRYFPGDRSADFVARVAAWRTGIIENGGSPLTWDEALDQFVATLTSQRNARQRAREQGNGATTAEPAPAP
jgi:hypothetical protein